MQRAGGVAALTQVALYLVTGLLLLLGLGIGGGTLVSLQALEVLKLLQAGAGLVLVFALAERLRAGGEGLEGLAGTVALAVASGSIGAALLLASGGVGYATLTLYELFPQAEEAPGATTGPVSAVSSALNAVVSGLGNAASRRQRGLGLPQRLGRPAHGPPLALAERPDAGLGGGRGAGLRLPRPGQPDPRPEPDRPGLAGDRPLAPGRLTGPWLVPAGLAALCAVGLATTRKRTVPGGSGSRARRIPRHAAARLRVRTTTRGRSPGSRGSVTTCPRSRRRKNAR